MDDRSEFGTLDHSRLVASATAAGAGLYGPSAAAAAAAAVNSGLMQLPSLADTAGRLGMVVGCPGLTPGGFGCPPGLHSDYSTAMSSLAQLQGWYRPPVPNQSSTYSDIFGSYAGQGGNWRNLSTPPTVSDHFHSPLPGMTHPVWPCPPTPVPCTDGCSLPYNNATPNMYSAAYSAYISLMSSSTVSDYSPYSSPPYSSPPYSSPRFPGSMPSYQQQLQQQQQQQQLQQQLQQQQQQQLQQQRIHDRHKAFLLANSAGGGHASPEFLSPWNPFLNGSSAVGPQHSPGSLGASGQKAFALSADTGSSSSKGVVGDEHKQNIKQEPVPNKLKVKDGGPGDHKPRDSGKRDQHRSWGHSNVSKLELFSETKPSLTSRKVLKDENLHSPTTNDCSLDLRSNNNNNANITNNNNLSNRSRNSTSVLIQPDSDIRSTDGIHSPEVVGDPLGDQKPHLRNLHSLEKKENSLSETAKQWQIDSPTAACDGFHSAEIDPANNSNPSHTASLSDDELSKTARSSSDASVHCLASLGADPLSNASMCQTDKEKVLHSDSSVVSDLTYDSKMETESRQLLVLIDSSLASIKSDASHLVTSMNTNHIPSDNPSLTLNSVDSSANKPTVINGLIFEEISNDEMDGDDENELDYEEVKRDVVTSESVASACWVAPFSTVSNLTESSQRSSFTNKIDSDSVTSLSPAPLSSPVVSQLPSVMSAMSFPSATASGNLTSLASSSLLSLSLPSQSSQPLICSDVSSASSMSLKTSTALKSDVSSTFSHSIALTLYMDSSVKLPKTSVSDGTSGGGQEIDLAMPRQSMRYQVSHHRQNPMQDGCKVHAPTFLPEVCTLPCNTITTITVSSAGGSPGLLRSTPSGRTSGGGVSSKPSAGQRSVGRAQMKLRSPSSSASNSAADVPVKTEKSVRCSSEFESVNETMDSVTSGRGVASNLLVLPSASIGKRSFTLVKKPVDVTSAPHPFAPMDFSNSRPESRASSAVASFSAVLPSDHLPFRSSCASLGRTDPGFKPSEFSSSQFTMAELNTTTYITPALGKSNMADKYQSEVRVSPIAASNMSPCEMKRDAEASRPTKASLSYPFTPVTSLLSERELVNVPHWDYNNVPENLSTKTLASDIDGEITCSDSARRPLLSTLSREGQGLARLPVNIQEGSTGIPVGIARALQRIIPQPVSASSADDSSNVLPDGGRTLLPVAAERPGTAADIKSENSQWNGIPSSSGSLSSDKLGLLCLQPLTSVAAAAAAAETDKQSCWKNEVESRPHVFSASFNHPWLQGGPPTTLPGPINPAAVWVGQFPPFHHRALLPYASTSIERNQSQQRLFHPGYKLVQDSITGQFFFIPVPDMTWPNLGSCGCPDANMPHMNKDKEPNRNADSSSPLMNHSKSEEVQTDTTAFSESNQVPSDDGAVLQQTDLSGSGLLPVKENRSLSEGVDVGRLGQIPVIFPTTRPPYFFYDSQLFIQDPNRPTRERAPRVCVESRGTSPIQRHLDSEFAGDAAPGDRNLLKDAESKRDTAEHEKATLNASVQTHQSLLLAACPEKACTAEISIQTSDLSDSDSVSSESFVRKRSKISTLRKPTASSSGGRLKLTDSAVDMCNKSTFKSALAVEQTCLIIPTVKDAALSDISSDEVECMTKSSPNIPLRPAAASPVLDERTSNKVDDTQLNIAIAPYEKNGIPSKSVSPKPMFSYPRADNENRTGKDCTNLSDLVQAVTAELSNSANDQRDIQEATSKSSSSQDLEALHMLSMIASIQLPAAASDVPLHQGTSVAGNGSSAPSVRKFNIFDLNISQFIEPEHSPDVSTSYNVPKLCFFNEAEFPRNSKTYQRYSIEEEHKAEDSATMSGILKPDEGPENMDPMELDLRMKMAEVQMKYKQKQKELARLQRKNNVLRNNSGVKGKKSKPVPKQCIQRRQSTSKQLYISSDNSSDSSTDADESGRESNKKKNPERRRSDLKLATSGHSVGSVRRDSGFKVPIPQKKESSAVVPDASSQFQKSKKEHRHFSDTWKKETEHQGKQFVTSDKQDELKPAAEKTKSINSIALEESRIGVEMNKRKPDQPKKVDIIREDVMLKKKPKQFCFYSYKKGKTSCHNKEMKKNKRQFADVKNSAKEKFASKVDAGNQKPVDDEWYRRRSERIFLHEASVGSISSPLGSVTGQMSLGDERSLPSSPSKPSTKPPRTLSLDSGHKTLSTCQRSELSVALKTCLPFNLESSASKKQVTSSSDSSDTDTDDVPLSTLVHKDSVAVELRSCTIGEDELVDNLRVLYLKDGHFYEGTVKAVLPPDVYRVNIDGERSSRQEVVSQEELLQKAILNVRPTSKDQLPEGSRICAYWSQKFSCLYPGTVKSLGECFEDDDEHTVHVEFDDGDSGKIPLTHISMLPKGYEIQDSETSSTMITGNRKRRNTTDDLVGVDLLQRPSTINRSVSVMDSTSYHRIPDYTAQDSSDGTKENSSNRQSSATHAASLEKRPKNERQEYSCRLKTESTSDKSSTEFGFGPIGKKSSQKKVDSVENENSKRSDPTTTDQKQSNLTLTIKRKQSREQDTSASSTDDDDTTSNEDEELKCHRRHMKQHQKKMKLEDASSASDADEASTLEEGLRRRSQKRKRRSPHQSTKNRRRRLRSSSSESGDQIGAFRPVWEQWQWYGPCTRRPGMKGKAKKQFYRAIQRGNETLKIGDAAVFVSIGHNDLQYVGRIDSLWESWDGNMVVKVKWYYHPEETKGGKRLLEIKSALYQSSHEDENDVQTVSHKCEVLSYTNFKKFQAKKYAADCKPEDVFYLAGTYDPTISMITYEPDVPLNSH